MPSSFALWAPLLDSDSDGIRFSAILEHVNIDASNAVDYERMRSLEGTALANEVVNWQATDLDTKQVRTVITYNDGRGRCDSSARTLLPLWPPRDLRQTQLRARPGSHR